jgi:PHD/YefM family antitoxin component YafN of YafNO toxin-antitoxin module
MICCVSPVHVIQRNRPRYVVLDEEQYRDLSEARRAASWMMYEHQWREVAAGRADRYQTTEELMTAIGRGTDDEA